MPQTPQIKAIETTYNGIRFRSRLEARWAVFLTHMGVEYEYEPEGFTDGTDCYLPDFWLYKQEIYLEVKPVFPSEEEIRKAWLAVNSSGKDLFFLWGPPALCRDSHPWIKGDKDLTCKSGAFGLFLTEKYTGRPPLPNGELGLFTNIESHERFWGHCQACGHVGLACVQLPCCSGADNRKDFDSPSLVHAVYQANNYRFGGVA